VTKPLRAVAIAAALILPAFALTGTAAAATWRVDHPAYPSTSTVPFATLNGVAPISASDVWAVGRADSAALAQHWNGHAWSTASLPSGPCDVFESSCQFTGVSGDSAGDVIAVGNGTLNTSPTWTAAAIAFRWNGSAWSQLPVPAGLPYGALAHVKAFSPTDVWAVGVDVSVSPQVATTVHWNGTAWSRVANPISTTLNLTMTGIAGSSAHDVWAVGRTESSGYHNKQRHSVIAHYDGTSWSQVSVPDTGGLLDVSVLSATNAWALGFDGSVLHWDGTAWTIVSNQPGSVLTAVSPTSVWVAGIGTLAHYDGSSWTTSTPPSGIDGLNAAASLTPGSVWVVGHYYPPSGASEAPAVLSTTNG
jgi:hypothetical protein